MSVTTCHTRIILMRHGTPIKKRDSSNKELMYNSDALLSKKGWDESALTGTRLPSISKIYSSNFLRAYTTAIAVAFTKGIKIEDIVTNDALQDIAFPSSVGQPLELVVRGEIPLGSGDETTADLAQRAFPAYEKILTESYGETNLLVSHGHWIRLIILREIDEIIAIPQSLDTYAQTNYLNPGEAWVLEYNEQNILIKKSCRMITHLWNTTPGVRRF